MMKVIYGISIIFICLSIISCGPIPGMTIGMAKREAAKSRPEYKQFQALCNSEKRFTINEKVTVDGYLYARTSGASCSNWEPDLFNSNYKYIECTEYKVNDYNTLKNSSVFHYTVEKKGKNNCIPDNELSADFLDRNSIFLEKQCLVREKYVKSKSDYAYLHENGYVESGSKHILTFPNNRLKKNLIAFSGEHLINIQDLKTIAIKRDYTYWPDGIKMQIKHHCDDSDNTIVIDDIYVSE